MSDMNAIIQPKSDQLNADSLMAGPINIRVKEVTIRPGTEQPISVSYEGDNGKPWKPCKTTARLMVAAWGPDSKQYVGRTLTLYCDPSVRWGGVEVGGIRISHMSHIDHDLVYAATLTKGKKAPIRVKPLKAEVAPLKVVKPVGLDVKAEAASLEPPFDIAEFEGIVNLAIANMGDELPTWWEEQKPLRLLARDHDKKRAGEIATRVNEKIETLKGDC